LFDGSTGSNSFNYFLQMIPSVDKGGNKLSDIFKELENVLTNQLEALKPVPYKTVENMDFEDIVFDYAEENNLKWRTLVAKWLESAKTFEIHCWKDEIEQIELAFKYGAVKDSDWKNGTIIEGRVTREFSDMLLNIPKPADTEIYNKMTPFFTIILDNGFSSAHYGTENIIVKNSGKNENRSPTKIEPAIDQKSAKIAEIQNHTMDKNGQHQGQTLKLIDDVHAAHDKGESCKGEYPKADLVYAKTLYGPGMLQNQIDDSQNHGAEAAGNHAPAGKFKNNFFHSPSYLLLISAKQRRET